MVFIVRVPWAGGSIFRHGNSQDADEWTLYVSAIAVPVAAGLHSTPYFSLERVIYLNDG